MRPKRRKVTPAENLFGCAAGLICLTVFTFLGLVIPFLGFEAVSSVMHLEENPQTRELGGTVMLLGAMVGTLVGFLVLLWIMRIYRKKHTPPDPTEHDH